MHCINFCVPVFGARDVAFASRRPVSRPASAALAPRAKRLAGAARYAERTNSSVRNKSVRPLQASPAGALRDVTSATSDLIDEPCLFAHLFRFRTTPPHDAEFHARPIARRNPDALLRAQLDDPLVNVATTDADPCRRAGSVTSRSKSPLRIWIPNDFSSRNVMSSQSVSMDTSPLEGGMGGTPPMTASLDVGGVPPTPPV